MKKLNPLLVAILRDMFASVLTRVASQIAPEERVAMLAEHDEHVARLADLDLDGDGIVSPAEAAAADARRTHAPDPAAETVTEPPVGTFAPQGGEVTP